MILLTLRALTSYWRRHRGQLLALLAGLTLATALWSAVQAINSQARSDYVRAAQQLGGTEQTFLARADGGAIPMDSFAQLRRAGWRVSPVMEARVAPTIRRGDAGAAARNGRFNGEAVEAAPANAVEAAPSPAPSPLPPPLPPSPSLPLSWERFSEYFPDVAQNMFELSPPSS